MIKYATIDDTCWPVDVDEDDAFSAEWVQRYGTPEQLVQQRFTVASILSAYSALCDPSLSMTDATNKLRVARQAHREKLTR